MLNEISLKILKQLLTNWWHFY